MKKLSAITLFLICATFPLIAHAAGKAVTHRMTTFVLELSLIILFARAGGYIFSRYLKQPTVLGELVAGIIIGPFALGGISFPIIGKLFTVTHGTMAVSPELFGIATIASIVLLFLAGLETDITMFLRFSLAGTIVGIGGAVGSFIFGAYIAVWFGIAPSFMHPTALFLGTISTATSVGITARILSEKRKLDCPEGVTTLSAAVIDDVLGIVMLAIVVGIAKVHGTSGEVNWGRIGIIATKAFGFWIVCTAVGLLLARRITSMLKWFRSSELIASLALGLALFLAGIAEMAGLAMIIGAFIMGLVLSRTDVKHELHDQLHGVYQFLVPIFFCVMGMLVNVRAMKGALFFGLVFSVVAILSKVIGCGLPALAMKFNLRGALRIGLGMSPRGEVALIIGGIGLASGIISQELFGVTIMMSLITALVIPPLLLRAFEGGPGTAILPSAPGAEETVTLEFPHAQIAEFVLARLLKAFRHEAFYVHRVDPGAPIYQLRREDIAMSLTQEHRRIEVKTSPANLHLAQLLVAEEMLELGETFEALKDMGSAQEIGKSLISGALGTQKQ